MFEFPILSTLWVIWIISGALSVFEIVRYLQNRPRFARNVQVQTPLHSPRLLFLFATKDCPSVTVKAVERVHDVCARIGLTDYEVQVLSDRHDTVVENAKVLIVPPTFQTPNRTRFKSRALHYAVEERRRMGLSEPDVWIFHLDEESFVTEQCVRAILSHIHEPGARPIASGPIVYPREWDKSSFLAKTMESVRVYTCYQCASWMTSRVPLYMHGSNLLVRSDVEDIVGWDFGVTSSEDQRFAQEASVRINKMTAMDVGEDQRFAFAARWKFGGNRIFDWHGGVLEEQPPFNVHDFIKQRQRWFLGNLNNLRFAKIPINAKVVLAARQAIWAISFFGALAAFLALVVPQDMPAYLQYPLYVILFTWAARWQIGLNENMRSLHFGLGKRVKYHLTTFVLTPLLALIETYPAVSALFIYPKYNRNWSWKPTPK